MARISLVEQYNNKDVITQVYSVKDDLGDALDSISTALDVAGEATTAANNATDAANNAVSLVNQLDTRTVVLEGYVGSPSDTADDDGSVYARIADTVADTAANTAYLGTPSTTASSTDTKAWARIKNAESDIDALETTVSAIPSTYQPVSQKNAANGYVGMNSSGQVPTAYIDTGVALNQILKAGAQLNPGEFLYIGTGGAIRSRVIGEGVAYVGNYASLAALEAYPNPQNGDFATVYGSDGDDGFYMYDSTQWNKSALFDATDYELIANKVTAISSSSDNDHYPTAKAVYDYHETNDVATADITQSTASGGVTVGITLKTASDVTMASDSVLIPTTDTPTTDSVTPITSGGVYTAIGNTTTALTTAIGAKQDELTTVSITLAAASWSSNAQTITGITNVTATNIVWVSPSASSMDEYGTCGIRVTVQASGSLTFETNGTDPVNDLTVIVVGA